MKDEVFIEYVQTQAPFTQNKLTSFKQDLEKLQHQGYSLLGAGSPSRQSIDLEQVVGTALDFPPFDYTGKAWCEILIERSQLRDTVQPFYEALKRNPYPYYLHEIAANITVFKLNQSYYILDGHKRIALARYFYCLNYFPASLKNISVINYEISNS